MYKNIILTGMSGCGKTTTAKELVKVLKDYVYIDIDEEIEKHEGKSINRIFEENGEQYFRNIEKNIIKNILKSDSMIISIGGGAFEDEENRDLMLSDAHVIYLSASAQTIYNRLKNTNDRPLLKDISPQKIENMMSKRINNYKKAHITIDTDNKNIYNVVKEIEEWLKSI